MKGPGERDNHLKGAGNGNQWRGRAQGSRRLGGGDAGQALAGAHASATEELTPIEHMKKSGHAAHLPTLSPLYARFITAIVDSRRHVSFFRRYHQTGANPEKARGKEGDSCFLLRREQKGQCVFTLFLFFL